MYKSFLKRTLDFIASLLALIILSPVCLIISLLLFIANSGKIFFYQERPGKNEKIFRVIKFKTMNDKKDANGNLLKDGLRLTKVGKFLRKTSLDEIPQLINVLLGHMSLIGPRPLLIKYLPYYTGEEKLRHSVRPGITGLAQVNGRNLLAWDDRLALDVKYVKTLSFEQDLHILFKTFIKVLRRDGVAVVPGDKLVELSEFRKNI